jgi:lysophospholipase L1-like esterase
MRFLYCFITLFALLAFTMKQEKKKIIFFGDSITEQGAKPGGYIRLTDTSFQQKGLDKNYSVAGAGISGNKVYDLYLRLEDDVLSKRPDAVVIWIGVNDVWHKKTSGTGTDADKFERFYNAILNKLKTQNIKVFLCTPATIGEKWDCTNELDGDLNKYAGIIRNIAQKNGCVLIDLRTEFLNYLKQHNPDNKDRGILTRDGVHLNEAGNKFVAQLMEASLSKNFIR